MYNSSFRSCRCRLKCRRTDDLEVDVTTQRDLEIGYATKEIGYATKEIGYATKVAPGALGALDGLHVDGC